jgi:DNA-binding NarL/FixJ family response regulator
MVRPLIQASPVGTGPAISRLTPRERQVLKMVVAGHSNKEIAQQWTVSEETIKHHLTRMFDKVGAANRVELAMLATRHGLLDMYDADIPATHNHSEGLRPSDSPTRSLAGPR